MANIRDVALMAGVGIGTVSRIMNGSGYTSEETRQKVMDAVNTLGYRPNELARNLLQNRSRIVGVMVPDLTHPFFSALTKYIETELYRRGYRCLICDVDQTPMRVDDFLELLQRNVMDGLITCVDRMTEKDMEDIQRPIVSIDRDWGENVPNIHSDHIKGGEMVADIFMKEGCRKILQFAPRENQTIPLLMRHQVLERIMKNQGAEVKTIYIDGTKMSKDYVKKIASKYAHCLFEADGVFASDMLAAYCMKYAGQQGIAVPERLKIVGYDGLFFGDFLEPPLTTVCQDIPKLAFQCVEVMMKLIQGGTSVESEYQVDVFLEKGGTTTGCYHSKK